LHDKSNIKQERIKQVIMVVGFVLGDSIPADETAIGLPEFEE
jgi:ribosome biogenesis SPOUT family RNA methylase Rps3